MERELIRQHKVTPPRITLKEQSSNPPQSRKSLTPRAVCLLLDNTQVRSWQTNMIHSHIKYDYKRSPAVIGFQDLETVLQLYCTSAKPGTLSKKTQLKAHIPFCKSALFSEGVTFSHKIDQAVRSLWFL